MAEEDKGFVIRDRRGAGVEPAGKAETGARPSEPPKQPEQPKHAEHSKEHGPPPQVNFLSFVYSMGTSALMYLGEAVAEGGPGHPPNLAHAQEIIDILTMLETKTKGNLTPDENALLEEMLYALRIKFVEKAKSKP